MAMYVTDHERYPLGFSRRDRLGAIVESNAPPDQFWQFKEAIGGSNGTSPEFPEARLRPLNPYTAAGLFACPVDVGFDLTSVGGPTVAPSQVSFTGTSYTYNGGFTGVEPDWIIDNKKTDWVRNPAKFVVMHDRPAVVFFPGDPTRRVCVYWHRSRKVGSGNGFLDDERGPRYSGIGYADGHAKMIDFSGFYNSYPNADECV